MTKRKVIAVGAATTMAIAGALTLQTAAIADEIDHQLTDARAEIVGNVDAQYMDAMAAEHDASWSEVYDRLALQSVASDIEEDYADHPNFGGVWINEDDNEIFLASTDLDQLSDPRATMVDVEYSYQDLTEYVEVLTSAGASATEQEGVDSAGNDRDMSIMGPGVHGGFVNIAENMAIVEADDAQPVEDHADAEGVPGSSFDVEILEGGHDLFIDTATDNGAASTDIYGGDQFWTSEGAACIVGFNVVPQDNDSKGFLTAGHCGSPGDTITEGAGEGGAFVESIFPGSDWAYVEVPDSVTTHNAVRGGSGSEPVDITGSDEAPVGSSVCRYSQDWAIHCGEIEARDQSVSYPEGTVDGLIQTTVCAEPGISGSPVMAGGEAQGMISGGSGNCSTGGTTFVQPVNPVLEELGLALGGA